MAAGGARGRGKRSLLAVAVLCLATGALATASPAKPTQHPPRPGEEQRPTKPAKGPRPYWADCGLPAVYAPATVIAHRVPCAKARRVIRIIWRVSQEVTPGSGPPRAKGFTCTLTRGSRPILCVRGSHRLRGPLPS
jgi:hypothetical protein